MPSRCLTALPVFNEARYVSGVLTRAALQPEVLVVDDGSTDARP
jgi:glycosyltransferase involved in cell wall biosynthesis